MASLIAHNLVKSYQSRRVVDQASFELQAGEVAGILGPNGAGKTTSFYLMVGLVKPDAGSVILAGDDVTHLPMHERAKRGLGYLPQEPSVFKKLTVAENVMAILQLNKAYSATERKQRLQELLQEFHIDHLADVHGFSLSGGERRRVEIARALASDPKYILLDEPFAGIDPLAIIDIKRIIQHLQQKGIGVLITDHNVRETLSICQHAYIVNEGKVLASGTPETILANPKVREVYLGNDFSL